MQIRSTTCRGDSGSPNAAIVRALPSGLTTFPLGLSSSRSAAIARWASCVEQSIRRIFSATASTCPLETTDDIARTARLPITSACAPRQWLAPSPHPSKYSRPTRWCEPCLQLGVFGRQILLPPLAHPEDCPSGCDPGLSHSSPWPALPCVVLSHSVSARSITSSCIAVMENPPISMSRFCFSHKLASFRKICWSSQIFHERDLGHVISGIPLAEYRLSRTAHRVTGPLSVVRCLCEGMILRWIRGGCSPVCCARPAADNGQRRTTANGRNGFVSQKLIVVATGFVVNIWSGRFDGCRSQNTTSDGAGRRERSPGQRRRVTSPEISHEVLKV